MPRSPSSTCTTKAGLAGAGRHGRSWRQLLASARCRWTERRTTSWAPAGQSSPVVCRWPGPARPGDGQSVLEYAWAETCVGVNGTLGPFAEVGDPDPDPDPQTPFTDVDGSSFAYDDVALLFELGITQGVTPTEYGPDGEVTREQMAAFLGRMWRALGNDCPDGDNPFVDISADPFAYDEAACIFGLGITTGVSANEYDPSGKVTREQMAAFLARMWRALDNECPSGSTEFTDVASSFAAEDTACIYLLGITTGTSATTYGPSENVTREQMAAFLGRLHRAQAS